MDKKTLREVAKFRYPIMYKYLHAEKQIIEEALHEYKISQIPDDLVDEILGYITNVKKSLYPNPKDYSEEEWDEMWEF